MSKDLLILSAELISQELQLYFGKLPSSMVPFQNLPALDYLYHEHVNHYDNIYIVVKKEHQFVSEFLMHAQYRIKTIVLPELGNLADSLHHGLSQIATAERAVTILFGDTYVPYMTRHFGVQDVLLYAHSEDSERWTVIEQQESGTIRFIDKEPLPEQDHYPVVIGAFHIMQPLQLLTALEAARLVTGNGFYQALEQYLNARKVAVLYAPEWVDYGHSDKYFEQKRRVAARSFNDIQIDTTANTVLKRSTHTAKFVDEINWFLEMPAALSEYIPTLHRYSLDPAAPFVQMDFYDMLTLHEIFIHGNHAPERWTTILRQLKHINTLFQEYQAPAERDTAAELYTMYVTKTVSRLQDFKQLGLVQADVPLTINGKDYRSLNEYLVLIEPVAKREGLLEPRPFNIIHGDFCFTNLLYDLRTDEVVLIDPRGSFGPSGIYGDNYYEWAKLAHSVDGGYDLIISDRFNMAQIDNNIIYTPHRHSIHDKIRTLFYQEIIPAADHSKVQLAQALLFFAMLPLHADTPRRQYVMLCTAVELFDNFIKSEFTQ